MSTGSATRQRFVVLPDGDDPEELEVEPTPPGAYALPGGLVDAHLHLALDFVGLGLRPADLVEHNLGAAQRAGILGMRDIGAPPYAPDLLSLPRERVQVASRCWARQVAPIRRSAST